MSKKKQKANVKTASEDIRDKQDELGKTLKELETALKKSQKKAVPSKTKKK